MRLILQRFDTDPSSTAGTGGNATGATDSGEDDSNESSSSLMNSSGNNEETTSFMRQLANCDKEELDEVLQQRVLLSTRAVSKVRVFGSEDHARKNPLIPKESSLTNLVHSI